ncbi:hypothetical protein B484DRAFT_325682 [Ochromonadaceae sp. CCMP2298]|nr:hypothetical protein B484DRAFT_325682 [Ochromonadaceae sp. CCMP2298]
MRYINDFLVGILCTVVLRVFNRFRAVRRNVLLDQVFQRPKGQGLLTVSNHQSVFDDPGLWGAILPFWRLRPERLRWSLCTEDIFFFRKPLTSVLAAGNVIPLDRTGSLEQPLFQRFQEKLAKGSWCHIFAEGKIWQNWRFNSDEPVLGPFKYGVGKLVAHSYPNVPIVLPMFHTGMSDMIPEKVHTKEAHRKKKPSLPMSAMPRAGQNIAVYTGQPMDFTQDVERFLQAHPGTLDRWPSSLETIELYEHITLKIRKQVLLLESEAYNRSHNPSPNNPSQNPSPNPVWA